MALKWPVLPLPAIQTVGHILILIHPTITVYERAMAAHRATTLPPAGQDIRPTDQ